MRSQAKIERTAFIVLAISVALAGTGLAQGAEGASLPEPVDVRVNNAFYDTFIGDVLADISLETGVPILADATVTGFVTIDLEDVPLPEALSRVLLPNGYTYRWMDGFYLVGSVEPDSPLFHVLSVTERVKLHHLPADEVPSLLAEPFRDLVRAETQTNSVIVSGAPDVVERIAADIRRLDVAPHQIRIDALVTEITDEGRKALGLDWSWTEQASADERAVGTQVSFNELVGTIGYSLTGGLDRFLMQLRTEVERGHARIRANPSLVALEGKKATLFIGKMNYYRIVTGTDTSPVTRLEAIEAGVSLEITARVADDGVIVLEIAPDVSDVQGKGQDDLPVIGRREVSTTVRVRDGETFGIGGLLQEIETETTSKVPILGNLPIFGRLFSSTRTTAEQSEVLIFITPHILQETI
ncbi:MAG: type II secretion system protein GspD [Firmicutes bacterium]|nr:type II secretion system protein GspD [Bacillota bacterium]